MKQAITLEALHAMDAIDQQGSFAGAAKILFKVPSALTYTIQKLETDLGVALYDRSKQRATLTPAGELVLKQGRELLAATRVLENAVQQLETGWETHLTITLDALVPKAVIFSLVSEFSQLNKMTQITLDEEALTGSWESLLSNRAQIVVGASGALPKGSFHVKEIARCEFCFAVAGHHELAAKDRVITADDIARFPSVVVADSATSMLRRDTGLLDTRQMIRVNSIAAKIEAQKMGVGIGFLPQFLIKDALDSGELVRKECAVPRQTEFVYLAWQGGEQGNALHWFTEKLSAIDWPLIFSND